MSEEIKWHKWDNPPEHGTRLTREECFWIWRMTEQIRDLFPVLILDVKDEYRPVVEPVINDWNKWLEGIGNRVRDIKED